MQTNTLSSILLASVAGILVGTALVPMRLVLQWRWENSWLVFSICAYFLSPWIVAFLSVPHLASIYKEVDFHVCLVTCLLGLGWGLAVVLFGIAVDWAGLSISTALLYGASVALGSLGALCLVNRAVLFSSTGLKISFYDGIVLAGVAVCALAGRLRGSATKQTEGRNKLGIVIALVAGVLSTLFNLVLVYGAPIQKAAIAAGAQLNYASNSVWALGVSSGSLPSIVWCLYLVRRNRVGGLFSLHSARNVCTCVGMALLWISGTVLYGTATAHMGGLGTVIDWPIYLAAAVISGVVCGYAVGEWKQARKRAVATLAFGVAIQIAGIVLLATIA